MKEETVVSIRLELIKILYQFGNKEDKDNITDRVRELTNYISTGNKIKRPVITTK